MTEHICPEEIVYSPFTGRPFCICGRLWEGDPENEDSDG